MAPVLLREITLRVDSSAAGARAVGGGFGVLRFISRKKDEVAGAETCL